MRYVSVGRRTGGACGSRKLITTRHRQVVACVLTRPATRPTGGRARPRAAGPSAECADVVPIAGRQPPDGGGPGFPAASTGVSENTRRARRGEQRQQGAWLETSSLSWIRRSRCTSAKDARERGTCQGFQRTRVFENYSAWPTFGLTPIGKMGIISSGMKLRVFDQTGGTRR
jgi:hypothetical protein